MLLIRSIPPSGITAGRDGLRLARGEPTRPTPGVACSIHPATATPYEHEDHEDADERRGLPSFLVLDRDDLNLDEKAATCSSLIIRPTGGMPLRPRITTVRA
jgi:hypothetical protein